MGYGGWSCPPIYQHPDDELKEPFLEMESRNWPCSTVSRKWARLENPQLEKEQRDKLCTLGS